MKQFELKVIPFEAFGADEVLDYKAMLKVLMEMPEDPQAGAGIDEIRKSIRILDALDASDGTLSLEDADAEYLKRRVQVAKFTSNHRVFLDFVENFAKE